MSADCSPGMNELPSCAGSTPDARRNSRYAYHRMLLWMAVAVLAAAFLLRVRADQKVELAFLQGWPAPEVCQSRAWFGWECPGCGLTRSFVYLAHGDVAASLAVHRFGWLVALLVALQAPYRLWAMRSSGGEPLGKRAPWVIGWSVMGLLIANWIANTIARFA